VKTDSPNCLPLNSRQTLADELATVIMRQIETGDFAVGDVLPSEQILAENFHVSRTVVREAMARLKFEGLVESRRGSGTIIRSLASQRNFSLDLEALGQKEIQHYMEFRMAMDAGCAALAALRRTPEQLAQLRMYQEELAIAIHNRRPGLEPDWRFHNFLAEVAGNEFMIASAQVLSVKLWMGVYRARGLTNQVPGRARAVVDEHWEIYQAIAEGDPRRASLAAQVHLIRSAARQGMTLDNACLVDHAGDCSGAHAAPEATDGSRNFPGKAPCTSVLEK
jgi:GntR family transcriptional repressor for pyruvate dehydrogenase complex